MSSHCVQIREGIRWVLFQVGNYIIRITHEIIFVVQLLDVRENLHSVDFKPVDLPLFVFGVLNQQRFNFRFSNCHRVLILQNFSSQSLFRSHIVGEKLRNAVNEALFVFGAESRRIVDVFRHLRQLKEKFYRGLFLLQIVVAGHLLEKILQNWRARHDMVDNVLAVHAVDLV